MEDPLVDSDEAPIEEEEKPDGPTSVTAPEDDSAEETLVEGGSESDEPIKDEGLDESSSEDETPDEEDPLVEDQDYPTTEDIPTEEKFEEPQNEQSEKEKNTPSPSSTLPDPVDKADEANEEEKVVKSNPERRTQDAKVYAEKAPVSHVKAQTGGGVGVGIAGLLSAAVGGFTTLKKHK